MNIIKSKYLLVGLLNPLQLILSCFQQPQEEMVTYAGSINNFTQENASERNGNKVQEDLNGQDNQRKKSQV